MKIKEIWKNTQAVIFDMDGVLIDSYSLHKNVWNSISEKHGFVLDDIEFTKLFGLTSYEGVRSIKQLKGLSDMELDNFVAMTDARFREVFVTQVKLIKGSLEFVKKLKENNFPTGIGTSAPKENVRVFLDSLKINDLFDVIVSGDDVSKGKPDPEIYLKASNSLSIEPEKCLVFEDSLMGITSAKRAGMLCVALSTTHASEDLSIADHVIPDFSNLWEIVEG
jgi:beta-phosphoglucomutase